MTKHSSKPAIDPEIINSIRIAAKAHGQSEKVSKRLIAWFEDLVQERAGHMGSDEDRRHFDAIRSALDISSWEEGE